MKTYTNSHIFVTSVLLIVLSLVLSACGSSAPPAPVEPTQDVSLIQTQAAQTVVADLTLNAPPLPTATLPPTGPTTDPNIPVAVVPTAAAGSPSAVANSRTTIYSGPGTDYVVYGTFLNGQSALINGRSEDGQWWAISVPVAPDGIGWLSITWYILHHPRLVILNVRVISIFYPVLPWMGVMALGYVAGNLYKKEVPPAQRRSWLFGLGAMATLLFILLRQSNSYGEPTTWQTQDTSIFTLISFLNTTKYPPSLQFLLMTLGPALILLALLEYVPFRKTNPIVVFGRVPLFFYVLHIYLIHALALLALALSGWDWREYILSAQAFLAGRLTGFGFGLGAVYAIWVVVLVVLYPLCRWYQKVRENHPTWWWLGYL